MSFDPNRNVPIGNEGTVYGNLVVSDSWGKLTSTGEALISSDFKTLVLGASKDLNPKDRKGPDWDLELADRFELKAGKRDEERVVVRK